MFYPVHDLPVHKGFSIIEVLISIIILSIGITGLVKLELSAVKISQKNHRYSAALILANEMAEKMSGNHTSTDDPFASPFLKVDFNTATDKIDSVQSCFDKTCTAEQVASANIAEWLKKISRALPGVRAKICLDDAPWEDRKNSYVWECQTAGNKPSAVIKLGWVEKDSAQTDLAPRIALPVTSYLN